MIKSLYVRITLIFIGAVFLSLIPTFYLVTRFYADHVQNVVMQNMIDGGKKIIRSYITISDTNKKTFIDGVKALPNYSILVLDQDGNILHNGEPKAIKKLKLSGGIIDQVLEGSVYRSLEEHNQPLVVGLPFQIGDQRYALFISPVVEGIPFAAILRTALLLVLFFGSLFILIAARYLVRPLKQLTRATVQMAKGDFDFQVNIRSKDEIGQLARSFNQMANELGSLEAARKRFVSDVSHEIQSPLTSIKGFTQALRHKRIDDATREEMLSIIEEETNRLSRLGHDLLQLSALDHEQISLTRATYRLDRQLRQIIISLEPQWAAKDLDISLEIEDESVNGDWDKLYQVWMNLIANAVKFSSVNGKVQIRAHSNNGFILVSIADNGPGIPAEEIEHIFKPFYKVDEARSRTVGGNGIGLSIVKRIVDLHKGIIKLESRIGEGTVVTVFLPDIEVMKE